MRKINRDISLLFSSICLSVSINSSAFAEEMDHSKHDMSKHGDHDTAAAAMHIHHAHGEGGFMFEYKFMRMEMDGLLSGSDSIGTRDISGATMGMPPTNNMTTPYMMSPTAMTMDMHMIMAMYGVSEKVSIMGMLHYLSNDMDMVMHMYNPMGAYVTDMTGSMDTSGVGDTRFDVMYAVDKSLTASLGVSLPTGSIDEKVTMTMTGLNPMGVPMTPVTNGPMQGPYAMQLGSGTIDLVPAVTYSQNIGMWNWGGQASYTLRTGENDNDYTLGDKLEITAWSKYAVQPNVTLSGRINIMDWGDIDGADSKISAMMTRMTPTNDAANSGGSRIDLLVGVSGHFNKYHMLSLELGVPIQQDLDGVQMETDTLFSIGYQYMMM